jgi:hypothetical protein
MAATSGQVQQFGVGGESEIKRWYAPLFLGKLMLWSVAAFFYATGLLPSAPFALIGLQLTELVLLVAVRPYKGVFTNLVATFYSLSAFYALVLVFLNKYFDFDDSSEIFFVFVLEILIVLMTVCCLARTARFYYQLIAARRNEKSL